MCIRDSLTTIAKAAAVNGFVNIMGFEIFSDSYFSYCISISVILQLFILPAIGAIADNYGKKKQLLGSFAFIGSILTMGLFFLEGTNYKLGGVLLISVSYTHLDVYKRQHIDFVMKFIQPEPGI